MQKHSRSGWTDLILIVLTGILFLAALFFPVASGLAHSLSDEEQKLWNAYQNDELIRLHIIANSDSEADQAIKLCVRDAIIQVFGEEIRLAALDNSDAVFDYLSQNISLIRQVAMSTASSYGYSGDVSAETGVMHLPEKHYGSVILPEGEYRALRITLGAGAGQNWWCVLYPQLCLTLVQNEEIEKTSFFWSSENIFRHWLLMGK